MLSFHIQISHPHEFLSEYAGFFLEFVAPKCIRQTENVIVVFKNMFYEIWFTFIIISLFFFFVYLLKLTVLYNSGPRPLYIILINWVIIKQQKTATQTKMMYRNLKNKTFKVCMSYFIFFSSCVSVISNEFVCIQLKDLFKKLSTNF